jgi:hypothetical protein
VPTARALNATQSFGINAANGIITSGIVVGTTGGAESINDTHLAAIVANGSGAGQLNYSNQTVVDPYVSGGTSYWTLQRIVTNNQAVNTVTIAEIGLYILAASQGWTFCALRDVLGATVDVTAVSAKLIQYIVSAVN